MAATNRPEEGAPFRERASQDLKRVPPAGTGKRYFGELRLGPPADPNRIAFIIDDGRPGAVTMYLDANQDSDLSNDPGPLGNQGSGAFARTLDLQLRYPGPDGTKTEPYRIWFFVNDAGWAKHLANYYARCHRRGTLLIDGTGYTIVLFDNPADGDYSNDPLVVDLNHDNKAQPEERLTVGDAIRVGSTRLTLRSISPAGDEVRFSRN